MNIRTALLKDYSSFRIGGKGHVALVTTKEELIEAVVYAKSKGQRIHILGEGTNTFFSEDLSNILCIKIEAKGFVLKSLTIDHILLTIDAGESWDNVVTFSVEHNLWGLENLSLIPGTVGAAPIQNIGAYGVELADVFEELVAYDMKNNEMVTLNKEACMFSYRDSIFKKEKGRYVIISVTFRLSKIPNPILTYKPLDTLRGKKNLQAKEVRDLVVVTRKEKLPDYKDCPNSGSFFKNPVITGQLVESLKAKGLEIPTHEVPGGYKVPAAWLIEHVANMKGVREGNVGTWPMQPLVLVNYGNATSKELLDFSEKIISKIKEKVGITLEREVNYVS
jgi:UDP-N-acetylmuramate dehydrogenase